MFLNFLFVACGGALGAVLRYGAILCLGAPYAIIAANIIGSFLMGIVFVSMLDTPYKLLLMTGVLGGFTTFSAFSLDSLEMVHNGQIGQAFIYIATSVLGSLLAVWFGFMVGKILL